MPWEDDGSRKRSSLYKKSTFKMKGNPFQRNFGIGSPLEFEKDPKEFSERISGPKEKNIVYKDGKKYYKASDGTLHIGQVDDYERELAEDKKLFKK